MPKPKAFSLDTLYCERCEEPCSPAFVDFGIGPYEYWGFKGVDKRIEVASDCCEALIFEVDEDGNRHESDAEPYEPSPEDMPFRTYNPRNSF